MINVFQLPARYPSSYAINEMTVSDSQGNDESINRYLWEQTNSVRFLCCIRSGQITEINEKEKSIVFSNCKE